MAKKKNNNENEHDTIGTKALLLKLCHSVTSVLSEASQ